MLNCASEYIALLEKPVGGLLANQTEIDARMRHVKDLYCEAEQYRAMKLAVSRQPKKPPIIFIPVSPRTLYQKIRKSILYWMAGLFPDLACRYDWVPCTN
jgi:hypothetical protein